MFWGEGPRHFLRCLASCPASSVHICIGSFRIFTSDEPMCLKRKARGQESSKLLFSSREFICVTPDGLRETKKRKKTANFAYAPANLQSHAPPQILQFRSLPVSRTEFIFCLFYCFLSHSCFKRKKTLMCSRLVILENNKKRYILPVFVRKEIFQ